jgi:hypothetical protein
MLGTDARVPDGGSNGSNGLFRQGRGLIEESTPCRGTRLGIAKVVRRTRSSLAAQSFFNRRIEVEKRRQICRLKCFVDVGTRRRYSNLPSPLADFASKV